MKSLDQIIGENIRARRESIKLSQKDLAKATKLTPQSLVKIEKGKRQVRSANLALIAQALGCSKEDLYDGKEKVGPTNKALLEVNERLEKENQRYKDLIGNVPEDWIKRLGEIKSWQDPRAMIARVWLGGKIQEIKNVQHEIEVRLLLRKMEKSEQEDPQSSDIA